MQRSSLIGVAVAMVLAVPTGATKDRDVKCKLQFQSRDWSVLYQQGEGPGTVTCSDGSSMPVKIIAKGVGLSAGKWKIDHGRGTFTRVRTIQDVVGRYATLSGHIGLVKTGEVEVASKGRVSLALAGHGEGIDVGVAINEFRVEKAGNATSAKTLARPAATAPAKAGDKH
ncbi:hypothetical protein [Cognatilysobacter lacus]|uniref:Uncharacterized protein n=1 Tax=Cognatilysobacter lacus TaxID=1643323 RepID=A0A5D8Z5L8_9GAMM|nr:hypothetical protein [Lysobacter lacus]TZF89826.1 hypothetical protein FW784_07765 [Lysobacter lacus]